MLPRFSKELLANDVELLDLSLVTLKGDFEFIYRPNDDSYLLIDTLLADSQAILDKQPAVICEIGCGSGFVISNLSAHLRKSGSSCHSTICTDVNIDACLYTRKLSRKYQVEVCDASSTTTRSSAAHYLQ